MKAFAVADLAFPATEGFFDRIRRLAGAQVEWILLRDKLLADGERFRNAERCRALVAPPSRLLIHGRADIAAAVGADGVHLPARGVPASVVAAVAPGGVVGRSCHSVAACADAAREGLAYALLGPVFPPRSKSAPAQIGPAELTRAATLGIDIYALGGISPGNLGALGGLPIAGIAGVTLFMDDEPLAQIVEAVRNA